MNNNQHKLDKTTCSVCGKAPVSGYNRPHSLHRTKRIVKPNTQKNQGSILCARCLRTLSKKATQSKNNIPVQETAKKSTK